MFEVVSGCPWPSGWGPGTSDCKVWDLTKGSRREWLFGNVVKTKVVGDDKSSCFKSFPDAHDHLGEVQAPQLARSGTRPRGVPGNDFLAMLLEQKLLGMSKAVVLSCFWISMTIWVKSRRLTRSGTRSRGVPGNYFLAMLLKQKLLGIIKIVIWNLFGIPGLNFLKYN